MHTKNRRTISILLSLAVMFSMCFAGSIGAFAESGEEQGNVIQQTEPMAAEEVFEAEDIFAEGKDVSNTTMPNYATIVPEKFNPKEVKNQYDSPKTSGSNYSTTYVYNVKMPTAGTLVLRYESDDGYDVFDTVDGAEYSYSVNPSGGGKIRFYYVPSSGIVTVKFTFYNERNNNVKFQFGVQYASSSLKITPPSNKWTSWYYHGGTGTTSKTTNFKVNVPSNGYLMMDLYDDVAGYSINYKTSGFKDYELLTLKDVRRVIGVKKGTYTFTVKSSAPIYKLRVKFTPVKESKYGTSKKKAKAIKKKKTSKALMITNAKKTHWYKFKNKKLQKVSVVLDTKISEGNSVGGLKVTIYDKKRQIYTRTLYSDSKSLTVKLYTIGKKNKLKKGTYYVKVESYKGGNGYFTVKWK